MSLTKSAAPAATIPALDRKRIHAILLDVMAIMLKQDVDQIDLDKSLDQYKIDSIDAVIAAGELSERLGSDLPPELLIQHRKFADIEDAIWKLHAPAAPAVTRASPVALFAGGGGRDGKLARLAERCQTASSFHTIYPGTWHDWFTTGATFDDLVADAAEQVLATWQGDGLRLAGYSQGGQLAYGVALALADQGCALASISIFDGVAGTDALRPAGFGRWYRRINPRHGRGPHGLEEAGTTLGVERAVGRRKLDGLLIRQSIRILRNLPAKTQRRVLRMISHNRHTWLRGRFSTRLDNALQIHCFTMLWNQWWSNGGSARTLTAPVMLFCTRDAIGNELAWRSRVGSLRLIPVAGEHLTMFDDEYLDSLTAQFGAVIEDR